MLAAGILTIAWLLSIMVVPIMTRMLASSEVWLELMEQRDRACTCGGRSPRRPIATVTPIRPVELPLSSPDN